jgi:hypothetical protein
MHLAWGGGGDWSSLLFSILYKYMQWIFSYSLPLMCYPGQGIMKFAMLLLPLYCSFCIYYSSSITAHCPLLFNVHSRKGFTTLPLEWTMCPVHALSKTTPKNPVGKK